MADQWKIVYGLSNGAIFNDLERPQSLEGLNLLFQGNAII